MAILFPYFELVASLFILLLAFQIWTRHHENHAARFFARLALVAFFAAILEYSVRIAFTLDFAQNLDRLSTAFWVFVFPMFAHFAFIFTKRKPWPLAALYMPPIALSLLFLFTNIMYLRFEIWNIGIVSQPSAWYNLFLLETVFYGFVGLLILYLYAKASPQKVERQQAYLIAAGAVLPLLIGVLTDEVLPIMFGRRITPPTAVFDIAIMMFFIYLAMRKYSLFAISPALAADTIIETIPDSLVVTDLAGRILFINEEAQKFFHTPEDGVAGRCFADLFKDRNKFEQLYYNVVEKNEVVKRFEAELVNPLGEHIPASINARLLHQRLVGEALGIVFVVRDIRG